MNEWYRLSKIDDDRFYGLDFVAQDVMTYKRF